MSSRGIVENGRTVLLVSMCVVTSAKRNVTLDAYQLKTGEHVNNVASYGMYCERQVGKKREGKKMVTISTYYLCPLSVKRRKCVNTRRHLEVSMWR